MHDAASSICATAPTNFGTSTGAVTPVPIARRTTPSSLSFRSRTMPMGFPPAISEGRGDVDGVLGHLARLDAQTHHLLFIRKSSPWQHHRGIQRYSRTLCAGRADKTPRPKHAYHGDKPWPSSQSAPTQATWSGELTLKTAPEMPHVLVQALEASSRHLVALADPSYKIGSETLDCFGITTRSVEWTVQPELSCKTLVLLPRLIVPEDLLERAAQPNFLVRSKR